MILSIGVPARDLLKGPPERNDCSAKSLGSPATRNCPCSAVTTRGADNSNWVRGQHVVHSGGKYLVGGSFADIQHVPQVLDLFLSAVSDSEREGLVLIFTRMSFVSTVVSSAVPYPGDGSDGIEFPRAKVGEQRAGYQFQYSLHCRSVSGSCVSHGFVEGMPTETRFFWE